MMKFQAALSAGLAALVVAPELTTNQDDIRALENALTDTVRALEVVSGLEDKLVAEPEATIPLVLSATESPNMGDEMLDERLNTLRNQVSLLRMELDAIESPMAGDPNTSLGGRQNAPRSAAGQETGTGQPATPARVIPKPQVSTGLDSSVLSMMQRSVSPGTSKQTQQVPGAQGTTTQSPAATPSGGQAPSIDASKYSADALGQAKANYNSGKFAQGAALLEGREDIPSRYWRARCLTRLEKYDEAIEILEDIVKTAGDSYEGRRASTDLEFAKWKQGFEKKLPKGLKNKDA